jgi:3-hydroxyisobutyrate dehydrogenase
MEFSPEQLMKRVGVVGVGTVGAPVARHLLNCAYPVWLYDTNPDALTTMRGQGAHFADTLADLAGQVEVILLCVPDDATLRAMVQALLQSDLTGKALLGVTTTRATTARELATVVAERGGVFLDTPVLGRGMEAEQGALTFFVGGDYTGFQQQADLFAILGSQALYLGESGKGQAGKMVAQMLSAAKYALAAEVYAFAQAQELDLPRLSHALGDGTPLADLLAFLEEGKTLADYLAPHRGSVDSACEEAEASGTPAPLTTAIRTRLMG